MRIAVLYTLVLFALGCTTVLGEETCGSKLEVCADNGESLHSRRERT